ncbi:hypothetical protein BO78DRAFT_184015 [Aspergillus sclerotiicarbonarius CBS 121057]|uniref:Uncharacterized protein n=1 Tax=Aspergillus sclerotiicarbonarius (strain CBS 121057 / IBT 28362) TaxID=1448318 RepID=A0A319FMP6_ASPSB|nr:hypothetical protein BO78DRAFT_184015 [Aspergillus sclerotiicarbonarius CBS 121057]
MIPIRIFLSGCMMELPGRSGFGSIFFSALHNAYYLSNMINEAMGRGLIFLVFPFLSSLGHMGAGLPFLGHVMCMCAY